ncbi:MAG: Asp-tRNA(Asn)/Glu-tRNA(Gln) amidotransferase subunit GatC [Candidatus Omnitrophica bacterium]|nr:Asp-tRNA(Asn)/Glu-tRNA(Gln) amidotransferase subunit GatC [Candidatus Omnitrophota bacterium]
MSIDKTTVSYIARLARINLEEDELDYYSGQLSKILNYIEKINELDLKEIPLSFSVYPDVNIYQDDEVLNFENTQAIIDIFPQKSDNFIKIPKVIE